MQTALLVEENTARKFCDADVGGGHAGNCALVEESTSRKFCYCVWEGQHLRSTRQCPLALDTETALVEDERVVPPLALASASDGRVNVVIHPDRLGAFLLLHRGEHFVGHNVAFDFWAIDRHLAGRGEQDSGRVLWDACDAGRLLDTQVLDMLLQLATGRFRHAAGGGGSDTKIYPGSLADLAGDYTTLRVSKDDPYRRRFGELVGLGAGAWADVEPGFFEYAARDAAATWRIYPALVEQACRLMTEHGYSRTAVRYDIRPDAVAKFGYLSELIQVKASVALAYLYRRGVRVDLDRAKELESRYRAELAETVAAIERDYPEVLTYDKAGRLVLTPRGQAPSLGPKKLVPAVLKAAEEIRGMGHDVEVPVSAGKTKSVSCSAKEWGRYAHLHPFLRLWGRLEKHKKLLEFFAALTAAVLHGKYNLLMRTGRTSCRKPTAAGVPGLNVQQLPRLPEFRALFVPDAGRKLFTGDYAVAELRTLAAVCRARYGRSALGDVIAGGVDPHAFTAAAVQGMTLEQFLGLKEADPKRYKEARQAAKAVNFGIPGGLGPRTLVAYARANYGVVLTQEEATAFRQKLIRDVYPELNDADGYLADPSMQALARNLGVKEREAWELLGRNATPNPLAARGVANVVRGTSEASPYYQAKVWDGLRRLVRSASDPDVELCRLIAAGKGSHNLHARLYRQGVATLTGRVRAGVGYTDGKNTPFQSLAADGAKLALWKLLYAGFDLYGFVHDEVLVELPAASAGEDARRVSAIMTAAMEEVLGEGIPAACEYAVADCWTKP